MSKWSSRRWWVCLWAMTASTLIIAIGLIRESVPESFGAALSLLIGVVGGYVAADSLTKPKIGKE